MAAPATAPESSEDDRPEKDAEPGDALRLEEGERASATSVSPPAGPEAEPGLGAPPMHRNIDENGVDLVYGTFNYSQTLVSIGGPGAAGLHYTRQYLGEEWTDNLSGSVSHTDIGTRVTLEGISDDLEGNGSTLALVNGVYVYTTREGKVARFQQEPSAFEYLPDTRLLDIRHPDGTLITFHYRIDTDCNSAPCKKHSRIQSVTSSRGYQIKLSYDTDVLLDAYGRNWRRVSRVVAINNSVEYCEPTADHCALTGAWPAAQIAFALTNDGHFETVTEPAGGVWRYDYNHVPLLVKVRRPGLAIDDTEVQYTDGDTYTQPRVTAVLRAGARYDYIQDYTCATCPPPPPYVELTTVEDPLDHRFVFKTRHQKYWYDAQVRPLRYRGAILAATDPIGNTTGYDYDALIRPIRVTSPEGDKVEFGYDARGNIRTRTAIPKTGFQFAPLAETAYFPDTCGNPKTCNKPDYVLDARQARTDFAYAPEHGGLSVRTGPTDSNGVQQQTRYGYEQRTGLVKTAGGGHAATEPVWLLTRRAYCRSSQATGNPTAPCATPGDEVVTTYDYGTTGQATNLLLRGIVVSADGLSLRTCYGYDALGNRISDTSPRAGRSTCQGPENPS
ncbi:MAG TPA: hypothetical protein VK403_14425 [Allosphingosinicella sp.]|nr:hypothetical protein [Allosphingosinicella sp.]